MSRATGWEPELPNAHPRSQRLLIRPRKQCTGATESRTIQLRASASPPLGDGFVICRSSPWLAEAAKEQETACLRCESGPVRPLCPSDPTALWPARAVEISWHPVFQMVIFSRRAMDGITTYLTNKSASRPVIMSSLPSSLCYQ